MCHSFLSFLYPFKAQQDLLGFCRNNLCKTSEIKEVFPLSPAKPFLKNYMEDCVWSYLDEILAKYPEVCQCEICRYDIVAIALNNLPPKYVVREEGELYSRINTLETQYRIDIYAALTKALMIVKESPRHEV